MADSVSLNASQQVSNPQSGQSIQRIQQTESQQVESSSRPSQLQADQVTLSSASNEDGASTSLAGGDYRPPKPGQ